MVRESAAILDIVSNVPCHPLPTNTLMRGGCEEEVLGCVLMPGRRLKFVKSEPLKRDIMLTIIDVQSRFDKRRKNRAAVEQRGDFRDFKRREVGD